MKKGLLNLFFFTLVLFMSCDWPFDTKVTDEEVFKISVFHDIKRIMPIDSLIISWNEITVDGIFTKYQIERKREQDTSWTIIAELPDRFQLSFIDTVSDDENLFYRVGIFTEDDYIVWGRSILIEIPNTDSIYVPTEIDSVFKAVRSPLVDSGDYLFVEPGTYNECIYILGKDIILKSTGGCLETTIIGIGGLGSNSTIGLQNSIIDGFKITGGLTRRIGGGVLMNGKGTIKNCIVNGNNARNKGGGIYINGDGNIYNTIIIANTSFEGSGIYIKDGHGEIINNTIYNNDVFIEGNCDGLMLRNNIFYQSDPNISFRDDSDKDSVTIDYSRFDTVLSYASNSFLDDPIFNELDYFILDQNSPCIDAGHPDEQYNDTDGSRNDMGAFGGPLR